MCSIVYSFIGLHGDSQSVVLGCATAYAPANTTNDLFVPCNFYGPAPPPVSGKLLKVDAMR
jgi:hypothetical protein